MAVNATFNLNWRGSQYTAALQRNLRSAVTKSAMLVIRTTKQLLNTPGQNVATKQLNRINGKMPEAVRIARRFTKGENLMGKTLKGFDLNATTQIRHGGTFQFQKTTKNAAGLPVTTTHLAERVYWNGYKWTTASEPGKPPHKQIGDLQKSIDWEKLNGGLMARVGPKDGLVYARIQELGGKIAIKGASGKGRGSTTLPPRPYLDPAFQLCITDITTLLVDAIQKTKP